MRKPVRVATIDSGINSKHPHVRPVAGGVHVTSHGLATDFTDVMGHGTAVAGAIREKAPDVELFAVKVFDDTLTTSADRILRGLDWCIEEKVNIVNLSLGTLNLEHRAAFEERVQRANQHGITIVSAYLMNAQAALPGSLSGVIPVVMDRNCPRDRYLIRSENYETSLYVASGYPRDIPGVPPERNLHGISFAVANVTGFLARELGV